jgi:hypothetical protein
MFGQSNLSIFFSDVCSFLSKGGICRGLVSVLKYVLSGRLIFPLDQAFNDHIKPVDVGRSGRYKRTHTLGKEGYAK